MRARLWMAGGAGTGGPAGMPIGRRRSVEEEYDDVQYPVSTKHKQKDNDPRHLAKESEILRFQKYLLVSQYCTTTKSNITHSHPTCSKDII